MIVYFETRDSESFMCMAHSVYVTPNDEFSLSVIQNDTSDYCLMLKISGSEYVLEKSSDWLDSAHSSFYWNERVLSSFNNIVRRFAEISSEDFCGHPFCRSVGAATRKDSGIIDIASLISDAYELFEQSLG